MNTPDPDRHHLLHELFESSHAHCGPTAEQVCRLVRGERARRRRRGLALATAAVVAFAAFATFATHHPRTPRTAIVAAISPPPPPVVPAAVEPVATASFPIEKVDDAGLLELLKDQPVALATLPNGERRLLLIVQAPARTAARPRR